MTVYPFYYGHGGSFRELERILVSIFNGDSTKILDVDRQCQPVVFSATVSISSGEQEKLEAVCNAVVAFVGRE